MNDSNRTRPLRKRISAAVALLFLASGCSKHEGAPAPIATTVVPIVSAAPSAPAAPSEPDAWRSADAFLASWLRAHGETSVVTDAGGVGVAGNETRMRASRYGLEKHGDSVTLVETEFRTRLPGGREIVEFVAGMGESPESAEDSSRASFATTTLHVIYRSFINPSDPHQQETLATIHGLRRSLVMGDVNMIGPDADFTSVAPRIQKLIVALPLSADPHWIKIVYAQEDGVAGTVAFTLDNAEQEDMTAALAKLPWPKQAGFYMAKQFIVVK